MSLAHDNITLFVLVGAQEATIWTCQETDLALKSGDLLSWIRELIHFAVLQIPLTKPRAGQEQEQVKMEEETRRAGIQ